MNYARLMRTISRLIVVLLAMPIHESAHAFTASRLGDPTAKYAGRLSLNPLRHIDPFGAVSLLAFGIGWAKPVPVDARYFKHPKLGMAVTAAAGPLSNLLLALLGMIFYKLILFVIAPHSGFFYIVELLIRYIIVINISLAIFNLLPFPPFDGGRIFTFFLPEKAYFAVMQYERYICIGIMALLFFGVLDRPLAAASNAVLGFVDWATGWVDRLFAARVGTMV